eukprot:3294003-Pleurochrysis_carterae.AAC.1
MERVNEALINEGWYGSATNLTINNPTGTDIDADTDNVFDFTIDTDVPHGIVDEQVALYCNTSLGDLYRLVGCKRSKNNGDVNGWQMSAPTDSTLRFRGLYNCQTSTE